MVTRPQAFQSLQRRQAHPDGRVAADLDSCAGRIARPLRPPAPPSVKGAAVLGETPGRRGGRHRFFQCRRPGAPSKTRGWPLVFGRNPHGSKRRACFEPVGIPRVALFSPRVYRFSPHAVFCAPGLISSLLLLFLEERERKERRNRRGMASTGWFSCNKVCPRVGAQPHGFSVDGFVSKSLVWRGFAASRGADPRPTGRNACVPPAAIVSGGAHGG